MERNSYQSGMGIGPARTGVILVFEMDNAGEDHLDQFCELFSLMQLLLSLSYS